MTGAAEPLETENGAPPPLRVLIVSPYASVRAELEALLVGEPDLLVVGQVSGAAELDTVLPALRPRVLLLDYQPGANDGVLEAAREWGGVPVVIGEAPDGYRQLAGRQAEGWAYLTWQAGGAETVGAIHAAADGLVVLDRAAAAFLGPAGAGGGAAGAAASGEPLTPRERDVLQLMAEGIPNKAIGARLGITLHTVKFHVASVMAKLGAESRTEAVTAAARRGDLVL